MSTVYQVGIEFKAKGGQELQRLTKQTEALQKAAEGSKVDALNTALGVIPGRAGAAVNGIVGLTRGLKDAQNQARATAAEIAALQAVLASKKIQLGAKGGIGTEPLKREIADIEGALSGMKGAGGAAALGMGAIAMAAAASAVAIGAVTASAVTFTNEIDRNRQQLTLFTKDVAVTNRIIASLQRTADTTSLGLPGLLEATKTMSAYGIEAKNAGAATKMLGDLALGDNEKLQRFAVNFAQISSLGKAYTVDLKQFGMAGIPIFDALSKATGKSTAEIMKMAEEGKITYPLVVKALQDLTKEGASFYQGAERGGTSLDRSVQQMQGSWEKLQQKIGGAVAPAIISAIGGITEMLDGVIVATDALGNAFDNINKGPVHDLVNEIAWLLKASNEFMKNNPWIGGPVTMLAAAGRTKKGATDPKADAAERAKLAADAQKKAEIDAKAEAAKLAKTNAEKVAKINLDTERSLTDARIGYEQQVSDFRRQQIEKIADMERQLSDERIRQEFSNIQSASRSAGLGRQISGDLAIGAAAGAGGDTRGMQAAQDTARILEESARARREIEFNATQRKVEIERRLSDFKRETERAMGEMQIAYARQTEGILRQAGQSINDLMVKGAQQAKEILESASFGSGGGGGGIGDGSGGKAQSGGAFSKWDPALLRATAQIDQKYKVPLGTTASLVMFESSGNTAARGPDVGGGDRGHGLFQIMRGTAKELGVNHQSILGMGGVQQMGLMDKYLYGRGFRPGMNPEQMYATVLGGNPWARSADLNGTTPGSGAAVQRGWRSSAARAIQAAGGAAAPVTAAARPAAPANNIVPTGSIPTTSPGLQAAAAGLDKAAEEDKRLQILMKEKEVTAELAAGYKAVTVEQQGSLKAAQDRNKIDMATLGLIRDGVKPELASQLATNQQLVESKTQELELLRQNATALLGEKGITAETKAERQKILDAINAQIGAQPGLLGQLNAEAQQTQAVADQRAAMDQAKSDAQGISSTITGGLKDAIKAAVTGGDVKAALSGMLGSLGDKFLDMAMRPLEEMLTKQLTQMFNPQALATNANTLALDRNTAAQMAGAAGGGGFGGAGGILGGLGGLFGGGGGMWGATAGLGSSWGGFAGAMGMPLLLASGGSVDAGGPQIVGERGPELFVPGQSGGITNHQNLRSMMASSGAGGGGANAGPVQMDISYSAVRIDSIDYVNTAQMQEATTMAAKRGAAEGERRALDRLRQSPRTRKSLGL